VILQVQPLYSMQQITFAMHHAPALLIISQPPFSALIAQALALHAQDQHPLHVLLVSPQLLPPIFQAQYAQPPVQYHQLLFQMFANHVQHLV